MSKMILYRVAKLLLLITLIACFDQGVKSQTSHAYAAFCSATQTDDCLGVSKDGVVYDFFEKRMLGKTKIFKTRRGLVVKVGNGYFCGRSDSRITKSYLVCSADGWEFIGDGMNLSNPWNPMDPWKR